MRTSVALVSFTLSLICVVSPVSASVTLNLSVDSTVGKTSSGGDIAGFNLRIGKFVSFTPTAANYSVWNANFTDLAGFSPSTLAPDLNSFVAPPIGEFGPYITSGSTSQDYTTSYTGSFIAGDQLDVWIYNSLTPSLTTQALLVTQGTWVLPTIAAGPNIYDIGWINGTGTNPAGSLTILGGVGLVADNSYLDGGSQQGVRLVTSNVTAAPEPSSLVLVISGLAVSASVRRRRK